MIGFLKGVLLEITAESILLDVNGVGYDVQILSKSLAELWGQQGKAISLWIYTHVREDQITLFGFETQAEKKLFLLLLKVNGVGPKMAMTVLSGGALSDIQSMIENGDAKALARFPRVGKKTAEQMILTLKGKLVSADATENLRSVVQKEVAFALKNLGFKENLVSDFILQLPSDISVEDGVREGLKKLTQERGGE